MHSACCMLQQNTDAAVIIVFNAQIYLSLMHKCQLSESVKGFWKNTIWDLLKGMLWESHAGSQKRRKRAMEKICRHQDDGEGPTSHKMKGRQRCPKCFCGLEGSQRGIDLLKSSIRASFSPFDGAIRAPQTGSDFLENEEWKILKAVVISRLMPLPDHHFVYLTGEFSVWSVIVKHGFYLCKKYPAVVWVLHSATVMWYKNPSFNETAILRHQLSPKRQTQLFC